MTAIMQTFDLPVHYPSVRTIQAPTLSAEVGGGTVQVRRKYHRPTYQFRVHNTHADLYDAHHFFAFAQYHQGDIPFWYGGDFWGIVQTPILITFGDGVRTQFYLPNRHILDVPVLYLNNVLYQGPQPTLDATTGLLTFASPPGDTVSLTATYSCRYKVVFDAKQLDLMTEQRIYDQLFQYEGIIFKEIVP